MLDNTSNDNLLIVSNSLITNSYYKDIIVTNVIKLPQLTDIAESMVTEITKSAINSDFHDNQIQLIKELAKNDNNFKEIYNNYSMIITIPYYIINQYIHPYKRIGNVTNLLKRIYSAYNFSFSINNSKIIYKLINKSYYINSYDKTKLQRFILDNEIDKYLIIIQSIGPNNFFKKVTYSEARERISLLLKLYRCRTK